LKRKERINMQEIDWEARIDNVKRDDIWQAEVNKWLEPFKSEETPVEKRITDFRISSWCPHINNKDEIKVNFQYEVIPVDENNTEWENPRRNHGFIHMVNKDGEYVVEYLSDVPKNYDKFLEEFEKWQKENETKETVEVQGEKEELNSNNEIDKMSDGIVAICVIVLVIVVAFAVIKFLKKKFPKLK